jgi:hypothetical protein
MTAIHIPGVENTTTESLSRLELSGDYQIKKEIIWPTLKVDLFARQSSALLTSYCSLKKVRNKKMSEVGIPERHLGNALQIKCTGLNPQSSHSPSHLSHLQEVKMVCRRRPTSCHGTINLVGGFLQIMC